MSDWQQQQQAPPGYAPPYQPGPPAAPPKKKTGLIVAVVIIGVLLLCCCTAVGGWLLYSAGSGEPTTESVDKVAPPPKEDPATKARLAEWKKVRDAYTKSDYTFADPDERQRRLGKALISQLLPDFTIAEFKVEPGYYDEAEHWYVFDHYFFRLSLTSDPEVQTAYAVLVGTAAADEAKLAREKLEVDTGDDVLMLEDRTWAIFPADSKPPLLRGIKDRSYVALMEQVQADFLDGIPTRIAAQDDGTVDVHVETWDSYMWSDTYDRIEATYRRDGAGWKLAGYAAVIEPKDEQGTDTSPSTQT